MRQKNFSDALPTITFLICLSAILLSAFRILYHVFSHSDGYLAIPEDDFYYYLVTAKNILHQGKSTFDGATLTNGYHPLWMIVIMIVELLSFGSESIFFIGYTIICSFACLFTCRLTLLILQKAFNDSWVVYCAVILTSLTSTWIIFSGMEVTLAIPLYLLLIYKIQNLSDHALTKKEALNYSFLSSLLILSRLDSIIFVAFFTIYLIVNSEGSIHEKVKLMPYFFLGGLLLVIYSASNYFVFGSFSTISAQAKQLKSSIDIGFPVLTELRSSRNSYISAWIFPPAFLLLAIFKNVFARSKRFLLILILAAPIFYLILFRTFSDWYIFSWYTYAFHIGNGVALASILYCLSKKIPAGFSSALGYASVLSVSVVIMVPIFLRTIEATTAWNPHPGSIYAHAKKIKEFTDIHPGIYAMGDRAGLTAYLTNKPIVQIEGIMADTRMVGHIATEDNLNMVLREYHVNYVIFSTYTPMQRKDSCLMIEVPFEMQSGTKSKKMKGSFCEAPVFYYKSPPDPAIAIIIYTYIFAIK